MKYLIIILLFASSVVYSQRDGKIFGDPYDSFIQDQHTETVDLFLMRKLGDVTLKLGVSVDDYRFIANPGHSIVVNNTLLFKEGKNFMPAFVTAVSLDTITISMPFDNAFTTACKVDRGTRSLVVNGATTAQVYELDMTGLVDVEFDITWMMFHIVDNVAVNDELFGGLPALTNGLVIRSMNGKTKNILNIRYNGDFAHHMQKVEYPDKVPAGSYALRAYKSFAGQGNSGVVIRLNSALGDKIQVIIRDDITGLSEFHATVHGHVVEN